MLTAHHTFFFVMYHRSAAYSAKFSAPIPVIQLETCNPRKGKIKWLRLPESLSMFHLKCRQLCITDMFSQIETLPIYLKQICIILIDPIIFLFQFRKSRKTDFLSLFLQQYLMSVITEHNTVFLRRFWVVLISIPVWCNILNHDFYLFFFYSLFFFFHPSTCIFICLRDTLLLKYPYGFHPRNVLLHNSFLFFFQTHGSRLSDKCGSLSH